VAVRPGWYLRYVALARCAAGTGAVGVLGVMKDRTARRRAGAGRPSAEAPAPSTGRVGGMGECVLERRGGRGKRTRCPMAARWTVSWKQAGFEPAFTLLH